VDPAGILTLGHGAPAPRCAVRVDLITVVVGEQALRLDEDRVPQR